MPGMGGRTSVNESHDVHDRLLVPCPSKKQHGLCRGVESAVGRDYHDRPFIPRDRAGTIPAAHIDRIGSDVPRETTSCGEFLRLPARVRVNRRNAVANAEAQYAQRPTAAPESVDAQIRKFMERPDLRNCCLPGMISRISRQACEGWQRQSRNRASKLTVKIKLDPCRKCRFYIHTGM
jgi:hypothetical protein